MTVIIFLNFSLCFRNFTVKPQVKVKSRITVAAGRTANISCQVKGFPKPKISWKRLDAATPSNAVYEKEKSNIIMKNVAKRSSGAYECTARNEAGTAKGVTILWVKEGAILVISGLYIYFFCLSFVRALRKSGLTKI